jgi:hypothetical protein
LSRQKKPSVTLCSSLINRLHRMPVSQRACEIWIYAA